MPIPGATVFETLTRALGEAQQQAAAARDEARRIDDEMAALVNQRSDAMLQLARLALPELTRAAVEAGFADVRQDLLTIVERKDLRAREVNGRLERLRATAAEATAKRDAARSNHESAKQRQADIQKQLTQSLAEDTEFQALSRQALASEAELKRDEERVVEISHEAKEKLPAYERSRLFQYLLEQRFGTSEYRGRGVARGLDRWIARLVEFDKASRSYQFLLTTPGLMDAEAARRKAEFHTLMQKVEDLEHGTSDRLGLAAATRAVDLTAQNLERTEAQRADTDARVRTVEQELASLDQEQGRFYEEALQRLKAFLAKAEAGVLERQAAATADPADDEVVLRIRVLGDEIAAMEPRVARQQGLSKEAAAVNDGLAHLARRFEQANFNESRSFFTDGFLISKSIDLFRSGALSRDAFWDEIKKNQERVPSEFEKRASETIAHAMNSPLSGALAEAMVNVAGAAMGQSVGRSLSRRQAYGGSRASGEAGKRWVRIESDSGK